jgi:hypothetical protein
VGQVTSSDLLELLTQPETVPTPLSFTWELQTLDAHAAAQASAEKPVLEEPRGDEARDPGLARTQPRLEERDEL